MNSPLVTVMVPSRGRVQLLERSLLSLRSMAKDPSRVQVVARVDADDRATVEFVNTRKDLVSNVITAPRGRGYADLHLMYNDMCKLAQGRFLFLWNDDATLVSHDWDEDLARFDDGKICYINSNLNDGRGRDVYLFPIVHRSWYDTTGHFSMSPHNDTYVYNAFCGFPQLFRHSGITIRHDALQLLHDTTSREAQQWWPTTKSGWNSPEVQNALATDIAKLRELVKQHG